MVIAWRALIGALSLAIFHASRAMAIGVEARGARFHWGE